MSDFFMTKTGSTFFHCDVPALVQSLRGVSQNLSALSSGAPRVVVTVNSGGVQSCMADGPVEVLVVDYDTEGCAVEELFSDVDGDPCFLLPETVKEEPESVDAWFETCAEQFAKRERGERDGQVVAKYVKLLETRGFDESDLDNVVAVLLDELCSRINNKGLTAQMAFALRELGEDALDNFVEEHFPAEVK